DVRASIRREQYLGLSDPTDGRDDPSLKSRQLVELGIGARPRSGRRLLAFHAGLPLKEQQLLEKLLILAEAATQDAADTEGFLDAGSREAGFPGGVVDRPDVSFRANQVLHLRR